jgi:F-type H+-transporting ATPase subunit delta
MQVFVKKGRASVYPTVVVEFGKLVDKHYKRMHAITTTAVAMEDELQNRLKTALDGLYEADVGISNKVDPSILGGIIVQVEGQVLDGSLFNQLQRLKKSMIEKDFETV